MAANEVPLVVLTPDEADALREIIGALAVIERVHLKFDRDVIEITRMAWRDLLLRPAARLQRVLPRRIEP